VFLKPYYFVGAFCCYLFLVLLRYYFPTLHPVDTVGCDSGQISSPSSDSPVSVHVPLFPPRLPQNRGLSEIFGGGVPGLSLTHPLCSVVPV